MSEPTWIFVQDCLAFHGQLLERFGGLEGVRDLGLLESGLARPQNLFRYGSPTLHEMAAAHAAGIVKNHPFLDGNKRSGLIAAALFLEVNGVRFKAPEAEAVVMTRALAAGEVDESGYARWLADACR